VSNDFYFLVNDTKLRVCKDFFIKTLDISRTFIRTALKKRQTSTITSMDRSGRKEHPNKTSEKDLSIIRDHINTFPTLHLHYNRKDSTKLYLNSDLNQRRMYMPTWTFPIICLELVFLSFLPPVPTSRPGICTGITKFSNDVGIEWAFDGNWWLPICMRVRCMVG
jgi:hypothetical protein